MNNSQEIYNYFRRKLFLNDAATFGLMANISAESYGIPNNLQNSYESRIGHTNESYTAAVDDGSYTKDNFVHDSAGYGLIQWTHWSRKKLMYEYAKEGADVHSIGELDMQLAFIFHEMYRDFRAVWKALLAIPNTEQGAYDAAYLICTKYEMPANAETSGQKRGEQARQMFRENASRSYTVQGDTVKSIADSYGITADELAKANGISVNTALVVGATLKIPEKKSVPQYDTYTVVKGDTLSGIGKKLGVPWRDIATANNISDPYIIYVGQKLIIPN